METQGNSSEPLRLHIGGVHVREGWKILNVQPGPGVDFVGSCEDLSQFADGSVDEVYASHIFEHLGYFGELPRTLHEVSRVMKVGGVLRVAVPDLENLCRLMVRPGLGESKRFYIMRMMYGGQSDAYDFHRVGFTYDLLCGMLEIYCFGRFSRVKSFGMFQDCSETRYENVPISLNVRAERVAGTPPARAPWLPVEM